MQPFDPQFISTLFGGFFNTCIFSSFDFIVLQQAYYVSRALLHFPSESSILLSFLVFFFFLSRRRLFWEVIPQKLLRNNFTWHVPIQGSTKGSRNIIHWRQSRGSRGTKSPCVCVSYNEEEEKDPNHLRGSNTARMRQKDGRDAEKLKYQCARNRRPSL